MPEETNNSKEWPFRQGESWKTGSSEKAERVEAYIEWLVTPEAEREPKTKTELAGLLGVSPATLRNYDKEAHVQREVIRRGRGLAKVERAAKVLDALFERALCSDKDAAANQAAKIWLDWVDKETARTDDGKSLESMTDEEFVAHLAELQKAIADRMNG